MTKNNCEQVQMVAEQNKRIEDFLEEVARLVKNNQKTSVDLNQDLIAAQSDMCLYKKELSNILQDFELKSAHSSQSAQIDSKNMLKLQKETQKNLESFIIQVNKRTTSLESTFTERLSSFQDLLEQMAKKELNDEFLASINERYGEVSLKNEALETRLSQIDSRFSNFRNEVNTLFVDYEKDINGKITEINSAVGDICRNNGQRNPLLG